MEKDYNCLFNLKYQHLIGGIVNGVRWAAHAIPELRDSKNGCIRITVVPLSALADAWLGGGLSEFGEFPEVNTHDVCERDFSYAIFPGGSHTIQYVCEDGHTEPVNCYGYSALKVAYASWKRKFDEWVEENDIPENLADHEFHKQTQYFVAENGYSSDEGVVYTTIYLDGAKFIRLYVTVSGAQSGSDDKVCAMAGMLAVQDYFLKAPESVYLPDDAELEFVLKPDFVSVQEA